MLDFILAKPVLSITAAVVAIVLLFVLYTIVNKHIWAARNRRRLNMIAMQGDDNKTVELDRYLYSGEKIEAYASQILGTRSSQQDSFYVSGCNEISLMKKAYTAVAVCDGMGGLSSGEIASRMAVDCIKSIFEETFSGEVKSGVTIPEVLKKIAIKANETVYNYGVETAGGDMCGTTMVLALLENNYLYWLSIGDSRIYIIRDGQIVQLTNDHNYTYILNQKVKEGVMTEEEALREANREALISYVGMSDLDLIDLSSNPLKLERGDVVLLCSDGLTKVMSDAEIAFYVTENGDNAEELAKSLPVYSFDRNSGSQDNTTVAVIKYS